MTTAAGIAVLVIGLSLSSLPVDPGARPIGLPIEELHVGPGSVAVSPRPAPGGSLGSIQISMHNTLGVATGTYQQMVPINSSSSSNVINSNWTNGVSYYSANGTPVSGWLETNASNASTHTVLWFKLASIPSNGWTNVTVAFGPKGSFNLSANGSLGEAPELSSPYGAFDNGAQVFNFYDNFAASSLSTKWTKQGTWSYTVKNGFNLSSVPGSGGGIYSKSTFAYPAISDFYGDIFQPMTATAFLSEGLGTSGCTSCGTANAVAFNSQGSSVADGPTPQAGYQGSQTFGNSVYASQHYGVFTSEAISTSKAVYELNYSGAQTLTTNIPPSPLPVGLGESGLPSGALANTETTDWIREWTYLATPPTVQVSIVRYPVDFAESGLPSGSEWWANVSGVVSASTTNTTLSFNLPDGTYSYSVAVANKSYAGPGGSFTVSSAGALVSIRFSKVTYAITFAESGLPAGTAWSLVVSAGPPRVSATSTIVLNESNGTYSYTASTSNRTYSSPTGVFTVVGAAASIPIMFPTVVYSLLFSESGLPLGTGWWVNVTRGGSAFSSSQNLSLNESNGTYSYSVATTNKTYASPIGSFAVDGLSLSVTVPFALVRYSVTFNETGLPSGTSWAIEVAGGSPSASTASSQSLAEPNGTYSYSASRPDLTYLIPSGSFVVHGAARAIVVPYFRVTTTAIFTETGLPDHTAWSVILNGVTVSGTGSLTFSSVTNGTYSFTVGTVFGYVASPRNGTLRIDGQVTATSIAFHVVPPSGTLLGLSTVEALGVLGGVAAVGAIGTLAVVLKRRGRTSRAIPTKPVTVPNPPRHPPSRSTGPGRKGPPPRSGGRAPDRV